MVYGGLWWFVRYCIFIYFNVFSCIFDIRLKILPGCSETYQNTIKNNGILVPRASANNTSECRLKPLSLKHAMHHMCMLRLLFSVPLQHRWLVTITMNASQRSTTFSLVCYQKVFGESWNSGSVLVLIVYCVILHYSVCLRARSSLALCFLKSAFMCCSWCTDTIWIRVSGR